MRQEIKDLWIEALESGKYEKGKGTLRGADDSYCCLGVLCDIYRTRRRKGSWKTDTYGQFYFEVSGVNKDYRFDDNYRSDVNLPSKVATWAGLTLHDPIVDLEEYDEPVCISWVNDEEAETFEPIVKLIKEQL